MNSSQRKTIGFAAGLGAFLMWGVLPLYWKQLDHISAFEVLANRIVWTAVLTGIALAAGGRLSEIGRVLRDRQMLRATAISSFLISANGVTFIWAVSENRITEVGLGYYITPLLNVVLGRVLLKEDLSRTQLAAVLLAATGVGYLTWAAGIFPWVSLVLGLCFALYGVVRKTAPVEPLLGLHVEMLLATPIAIGWLVFATDTTGGAFFQNGRDALLLLASGLATLGPLYLFNVGAKRLRYATIGIMMFIAPTMQVFLAVVVNDEPFTENHGISFALIWTAISVYAVDTLRRADSKPEPANAVDQSAEADD
ncbi:MAG: EamA family transporter RarD [Myxococcota bacterium]